jgi:hypothetical protein
MFIPFYQDRSSYEIMADVIADIAWCVGFVVGLVIALHDHFSAVEVEATVETIEAQVLPQVGATVNMLRDQCKARGIRWNRAGAGGKHLTKDEMIAALSEI